MKPSIVTAQGVERLERGRPAPTAKMELTIGGTVETEVHAAVDAQREQAIAHGHAQLNGASDRFAGAMATATGTDLARQHMASLKQRALARRERHRTMARAFSQAQE